MTALNATCPVEGCPRLSRGPNGGPCKNHGKNRGSKTSDGRRTGGTPKLTAEQVAEARRMRAAFRTNREIASHFGVSLPTLRRHLARGPS